MKKMSDAPHDDVKCMSSDMYSLSCSCIQGKMIQILDKLLKDRTETMYDVIMRVRRCKPIGELP